jgi:hypothetical protein
MIGRLKLKHTVRSRAIELVAAAKAYEQQLALDVGCCPNGEPNVVRTFAFTAAAAAREICETILQDVEAQEALDAELRARG